MKRTRLRNNFLRTKSQEDWSKFNKQRNFYKKKLRTTKKFYFSNLDIKKVVGSRSIWKTVPPLFSTTCLKGDKIISMETMNAYLMTPNYITFFVATSPILFLNFKFQLYPKIFQTWLTDPALVAISMSQDHPSVKNIRTKKFTPVFSLTHAKEIETKKILKAWKYKTFAKLKDIPTKIIKMNADIFTNFICLHFNFCIDIGEFPQAFKHAEIIPVHNKKKKVTKLITDLSAYCQTFLKFIKNVFTINCMVILIKYFIESMWIPQRI